MTNTSVTLTAPAESIRRRYAATLFTQSVQLVASVVSAGVVPRTLGPAVYGSYNFLLNTASTIRGFLEPSAEQAFFTFSSQERRSGSLTKLYGLVQLIQMALIFVAIGLAALAGVTGWLWPGQQLDHILWVTLLDWAMFFVMSLRQLGDSKGLTVRAQMIATVTALTTIVGLLALAAVGWLNFYTYVGLNLIAALFSGATLAYYLLHVNSSLCWTGELRGRVRGYLRRWWHYASPLIMIEYYTPLVAYLSTYLVQRWYGSVEQGYFALASRWSAFVLVFTSSALMIFWREIANATATGERERAGRVFLQFNQLLFFLALVLCFWLSLSSHVLVPLLAGEQYQKTVPVLMVMAFYPLAQTYGQLNTAALKAVERTSYFRNWALLFSIPDILLTYFLLAPNNAVIPGLGLGAMGVALKMVVYSLLTVQVYEWSNLSYFGLSHGRILMEKLIAAAAVGGCGLLTLVGLSSTLQAWGVNAFWSLAMASAIYFSVVGGVFFLWPELAGLKRTELLAAWQMVIDWVKTMLPPKPPANRA